MMKTKKKRNVSSFVIWALLLIGSLAMILPLYWMIISSFKSQTELLQMPPTIWPEEWRFSNYLRVFQTMPFLRYYANSLIFSAISTVVGVFSSCIIGYVFAKYRFRGRNALFLCMLACMMIPYDTLMIPLYKIMVKIHFVNTPLVLTIPYFINIFGVFLMRQFFMDLPDDYLEAAEMDGCGQFRTFWSVAMPIAQSSMAALFIYLFMAVYNSYLWPLINVNSRDLFTLPVGIAGMINDRGNQFDLMMAASTMVIVPVAIVFACAQKRFIEGIAMGGIKG